MKEEPGKTTEAGKSRTIPESEKCAEAQANFENAMEAMARLRDIINRRPGRLIHERKPSDRSSEDG